MPSLRFASLAPVALAPAALALAAAAPAWAAYPAEVMEVANQIGALQDVAIAQIKDCAPYADNHRAVHSARRECETKMQATAAELLKHRDYLSKVCIAHRSSLEELNACLGIRDEAQKAALHLQMLVPRMLVPN